jgi:hypothetical protein
MKIAAISDEWFDSVKFRVYIGACLLAGLALRTVLLVKFANPANPYLWEFGVVAKNLYLHDTFAFFAPNVPSIYMPPGFPILIWMLYELFGMGAAAHIALAVILLLLDMTIPISIGVIASRVWNRSVAVIAFTFAMFWPHLLLLSGRLNSIAAYTPLIVGATAVILLERPKLMTRAAIAGLILGIYATMRWDALLNLVPFTYIVLRTSSVDLKKRVFATVLLFTLALVPMSMWLVRNYGLYDRVVVSSQGWVNVVRGHNVFASGTGRDPWPAGAVQMTQAGSVGGTAFPGREILWWGTFDSLDDEIRMDMFYKRNAMQFIRHYWKREFGLVAKKLFFFNIADFTHSADRLWPIWLPSVTAFFVGLVFWFRSGLRDPRQQVLWMLYGVQLFIATTFYVMPRYRLNVVFVSILFFSAWVGNWLLPFLRQKYLDAPGKIDSK